ncbi:MAG: D-ribitol-5-phosphate cytidylyltransferase [Senegalimassilia faecalis]
MESGRNVYAAILAGGSGTRMGNPEKPKQFLMLGSKPIIAHTVEKFCAEGVFERVLVLCPESWIQKTQDLLRRYCPDCCQDVAVIAGGSTRNDTVRNAISYLCENHAVDDSSIIVTHDAVRPFVSHRIIEENIQAVIDCGACDTVVPATDTIVQSLTARLSRPFPTEASCIKGKRRSRSSCLSSKRLWKAFRR